MGTNFYTQQGNHIGKRSAAGFYCFDCKLTLAKGSENSIHHTDKWWESCPKCGTSRVKELLFEGAVGRELGFHKKNKKGMVYAAVLVLHGQSKKKNWK